MTKNISSILCQPYQSIQTYRDLQDIVDKAVPDISFWGWRYITVPGYEEKRFSMRLSHY